MSIPGPTNHGSAATFEPAMTADKPFPTCQAMLAPPTLGDYKVEWERPKASSSLQKMRRHAGYNLRKLAARILPGRSVQQVRLHKYESCLARRFQKALTGSLNPFENKNAKQFIHALERTIDLGAPVADRDNAKGRYGPVLERLVADAFPGDDVPIEQALIQVQRVSYAIASTNDKSANFNRPLNPTLTSQEEIFHPLNRILIAKVGEFMHKRRHDLERRNLEQVGQIEAIVDKAAEFSLRQFEQKAASAGWTNVGKAEQVTPLRQSVLATYGDASSNEQATSAVRQASTTLLLKTLSKHDFVGKLQATARASLLKVMRSIEKSGNFEILKDAVASLPIELQPWQTTILRENIESLADRWDTTITAARKTVLEEIAKRDLLRTLVEFDAENARHGPVEQSLLESLRAMGESKNFTILKGAVTGLPNYLKKAQIEDLARKIEALAAQGTDATIAMAGRTLFEEIAGLDTARRRPAPPSDPLPTEDNAGRATYTTELGKFFHQLRQAEGYRCSTPGEPATAGENALLALLACMPTEYETGGASLAYKEFVGKSCGMYTEKMRYDEIVDIVIGLGAEMRKGGASLARQPERSVQRMNFLMAMQAHLMMWLNDPTRKNALG